MHIFEAVFGCHINSGSLSSEFGISCLYSLVCDNFITVALCRKLFVEIDRFSRFQLCFVVLLST